MRGSVSVSEWKDTLALTHCLPLNHSVEGETVCKREGEWEWVEGESV